MVRQGTKKRYREILLFIGAIGGPNGINETFYSKMLRVVTSIERLTISRGTAGGFRRTQVSGDVLAAAGVGATSEDEIAAIVDELRRLADDRFSGSVGVVTPFRPQANWIHDRVYSAMGEQLPGHWRFHVDTADGFQGDERDVILLSLVGEELRDSTYRTTLESSQQGGEAGCDAGRSHRTRMGT